MGLYTRDKFYMWAVHGQCPQFSRSLLWSDLRVCAGLAGFPGPKSEFGRGGVRVHRRAQQNPEKWIQAGAYPESARAMYSLRSCPCAPSFAGAQRQPKDQIDTEMNGLDASSDFAYGFGKLDGAQVRACVCAWRRPPLCCVPGLCPCLRPDPARCSLLQQTQSSQIS